MAVAAETLSYEQTLNPEQQPLGTYLSVDQLPELRLVRELSRASP